MTKENIEEKKFTKYLGGYLTSLRMASGYSRKEIADAIGVTHQQVAKYESGEHRISIYKLDIWLRMCGTTIEEFMPRIYPDEIKDDVPCSLSAKLSRKHAASAKLIQQLPSDYIQPLNNFLRTLLKIPTRY